MLPHVRVGVRDMRRHATDDCRGIFTVACDILRGAGARCVAHAGMGLTDDHMAAVIDFLEANPQLKELDLSCE